jgi:membrane protein implicated in regulation of membrane protease activity
MSSAFVVSAVSTGVVVIAVAAAVVLVVVFVTLSMRGRQKRGARRIDERRDVDEARGRAAQAERDRDIAREGGKNLGPQR